MTRTAETAVAIPVTDATLEADLARPENPVGAVAFAHGTGSSRHSPRNRQVAGVLQEAGLLTLLADLLTADEERVDMRTRHLRFDIDLLADRLVAITNWLSTSAPDLPIGLFGASTGGAAALVAAARNGVAAVVSRGGRPDLAGDELARVRCPTLLVVGGNDAAVLELNRQALAELRCPKRIEMVPGATHLFEEPGALDAVAHLARGWFLEHLPGA